MHGARAPMACGKKACARRSLIERAIWKRFLTSNTGRDWAMQSMAATPFEYAVFTLAIDDAQAVNIPIGVALWSTEQQWVDIRIAEPNDKLAGFRPTVQYPFVSLVR